MYSTRKHTVELDAIWHSQGVIMSLTITKDMMRLQEAAESMGYGAGNSATARMLRQIEEIARFEKQIEAVRQVEELKKYASGVWNAINETQRRAYEQVERFRQQMTLVERLRREVQTVRHRGQDGPTGKAKVSSAKKSAKSSTSGGGSSGGDGGDGGGDGDGPQRARSTSKKAVHQKALLHAPQRLPSSSSGKTAPISLSQVSPNHAQSNRGIVIIAMALLFGIVFADSSLLIRGLIVVCLLIIALAAMGYVDLAKHVWNSAPKLLKLLKLSAKNSDEESGDPDEES